MIDVRTATPADRDGFLVLWAAYLESQRELGGDILPTARSLEFFGRLFDLYVADKLEGALVLAEHDGDFVGVVMWGEMPRLFDVRWKKPAQGWGTYVAPKARGKGVSDKLREAAKKSLREQGFDVVIGYVLQGNYLGTESTANFGFKATQQVVYLEL